MTNQTALSQHAVHSPNFRLWVHDPENENSTLVELERVSHRPRGRPGLSLAWIAILKLAWPPTPDGVQVFGVRLKQALKRRELHDELDQLVAGLRQLLREEGFEL